MDKFPCGIPDIDREILSLLDDSVLFNACIANKYLWDICNDAFWQRQFIKKFGRNLGHVSDTDRPYLQLYGNLDSIGNEELVYVSIQLGYLPLLKSLNLQGIVIDWYLVGTYGYLEIIKYLITQMPMALCH